MEVKAFQNFYKNRSVLITGHTGFKGAWLSLWLLELGANVAGYSLYFPSNPNLFQILQMENRLANFSGDIIDQDKFEEVILKTKPEIIFHLAAQSLVSESYIYPVQTFETNITGTAKILDACRKFDFIKAIIIVTSDKCYENNNDGRVYNETCALGGKDPYSASKGCAEIVASAYRDSFFNLFDYNKTHSLLIATVRAGNVIGGGDWGKNRLVPDCVRALSENSEIYIRNPGSVRPWQFILDPLSGYLWLGRLLASGEQNYSGAWNFGPVHEGAYNVEELVKKIIQLWGGGKYSIQGTNDFRENTSIKLDTSKASSCLHWMPILNVDETLEYTAAWYKKYYKGEDVYNHTQTLLKEYTAKAMKMGLAWLT